MLNIIRRRNDSLIISFWELPIIRTQRRRGDYYPEGVRKRFHIGNLDQMILTEEENRPHDIVRFLQEALKDNDDSLIKRLSIMCQPYSLYTMRSDKLAQLGVVNGDSLTLVYLADQASATLDVFIASLSTLALEVAAELLPKYLFVSQGSLKFICYDFVLDAKNFIEKRGEITIGARATCTVVSLSYWEIYVEPWLHLPYLLLKRPNPKMTQEILAYWSDVAGFDILLESLERVIIGNILVAHWDDDVWIPAHELLSVR